MSPVHFGDEPSPFVVAEAPVAAPPKVPGLALPVMAPLPAPAPTPALFASDILDDEPPPWRRPRRRRMRKHQPFFKPFVGGGDDLVQASSVGPSLAPLEPLRESVDALAMRCAKVEEALRERASVVRAPAPAPSRPRVQIESPPVKGRASKQTKKVWGEASALMQRGDLDGSFPVWKSKFYRVRIAASPSTPSTRRLLDDVVMPVRHRRDRTRTAASSPRNDLVKNYLVHPTH